MTNEMTAEEAIQWLDAIKKYYIHGGDEAYDKKRMKAIDMAIKALEQQPCDDCISREAVLDVINFEDEWLFDAKSHNADTKIAFSAIKSKISELPSVTPQTVTEFADKCKECGKIQNEFFNFDAPMVKNSEAVSRSEAINSIKYKSDVEKKSRNQNRKYTEGYDDVRWIKGYEDGLDDAIIIINSLPSVTPQYTDEEIDKAQAVEQAYVDKMVELAVEETKRPKGKWIEVEVRNVYATLKCSVCGRVIEPIFDFCKYSYEDIKRSYPYCHCGAEMSGGGEDGAETR